MAQFEQLPTPMCQILVEHFHGAVTRVPVGDTAYALRHTGYNILIASQWMDPKDDERCTAWARESIRVAQAVRQRAPVRELHRR